MSEPEYRYIKGQGWVVSNAPCSEPFKHRDKLYRLECRPPIIGEIFSASRYNYSRWWDSNTNEPAWENWMDYPPCITYDGTEDYSIYDFTVVLVPLD